MITYIDSGKDLIACSIRGGFDSAEMNALVSKVEQALEANDKTHMFVEIDRLGDVNWPVIAEQMSRAFPILRQLGRFGRIAVVSDDRWIRLWTRTESALLPNISYELFRARERDRALEWVRGRVELPHAPALTIIPTDNPSVIAYELDGSVTAADMDKAVAEFGPVLRNGAGPVRAFAKIGKLYFPSFSTLLRDCYLDLKRDSMARLERYAVIGGPDWLRQAIRIMAPLLAFEIRYFEPAEEAAAWQWIGACPAKDRSVTAGAPQSALA